MNGASAFGTVAAIDQPAAAGSAASPARNVAGERSSKSSVLHRYMPALDGLRGIAILWVILHHLPGQMDPDANFIAKRGPVGVELFFAISGFLVTRSLYQCIERAGGRRQLPLAVVRDFAARRIARIWPPYFIAIAAAFGGMMLDPTFRSNSAYVRDVFWAFPLFLANYVIPTHPTPLSLSVMWSLCFEEQFYVVLLLMYVVVRRRVDRLWWLIAAAGVLSMAARLFAAIWYPEIFTKFVMAMETHWRFDAIAWGCLVWVFHRPLCGFWESTRHRALLQFMLLVAAVAISAPLPAGAVGRAWHYLLMAPLFAALVSALAFAPSAWLTRTLAWTPLAFIGVISYEIYLSHTVVYRVIERAHPRPWGVAEYALLVAAAVVCGWVFHRVFGKPTQRWVRDRMAGRVGEADKRLPAPVPAET